MTGSVVLLAVVLIIVGCAIYLFLKATFVKAFAMAIAAVCASAIALGFFSTLSNSLVGFSDDSELLAQWGPLLCFVLLFIVAFAVLQTIINLLTRQPIDLGFWPERIGRAACGAFLGFTLSRILLAALIMSFLPGLQTSTLGKYLGYKGINPPKQTQQKKTKSSYKKREATPPKASRSTPKGRKLSDTSKSILGPEFE
jgi:hypothetical protein